jgi:hypothetical protein
VSAVDGEARGALVVGIDDQKCGPEVQLRTARSARLPERGHREAERGRRDRRGVVPSAVTRSPLSARGGLGACLSQRLVEPPATEGLIGANHYVRCLDNSVGVAAWGESEILS